MIRYNGTTVKSRFNEWPFHSLNRHFLVWNSILVTRFHSLNRDFSLYRDSLNPDFTVLCLLDPRRRLKRSESTRPRRFIGPFIRGFQGRLFRRGRSRRRRLSLKHPVHRTPVKLDGPFNRAERGFFRRFEGEFEKRGFGQRLPFDQVQGLHWDILRRWSLGRNRPTHQGQRLREYSRLRLLEPPI